MVNDDVNNKAINLEIKVAQYSAKAILKAMKKIMEDAAEKSQPLAKHLSEKLKNSMYFCCEKIDLFSYTDSAERAMDMFSRTDIFK